MLSPLLFSLFIAEVAYKIAERGRAGVQLVPGTREIFSLLFADDIALIARTPAGLQHQINSLRQESENLGLNVNLGKTKIMVCRKGGYLGRHERWYYGRERLEVVNNYKYLGYTITTKLSTDIPLSEFAGKAKSKIISIFRTLYKLGHIDTKLFFKLFDTQVKPMLLYAAEIWGVTQSSVVEKIHMYACKKLLGTSIKTPNTLVYGETGRYPIYIDGAIRSLKYWFRIINLSDNRIPKLTYYKELQDLDRKMNWAKNIKDILERNGYGIIWNNQGTHNINSFMKAFKQRLIDQFQQNWHAKLEGNIRYMVYAQIKQEWKKEEYLEYILISKYRKSLARLRMGTNELNCNKKFRFQGEPDVCPFCPIIEDEAHFLLECYMYRNLRYKYISRHWITLNNIE